MAQKMQCPLKGMDGCLNGGGAGLSRKYFIDHLCDRHFLGEDRITKHRTSLESDLVLYSAMEEAFRKVGIWLCCICWKTHTCRKRCRHEGEEDVPAPDCGDGVIQFRIFGLVKPTSPCSGHSDGTATSQIAQNVAAAPIHLSASNLSCMDSETVLCTDLNMGLPTGACVNPLLGMKTGQPCLNVELLDSIFNIGVQTVKNIPVHSRLGFAKILKHSLDQVVSNWRDEDAWIRLLILPACTLRSLVRRENTPKKSGKRHFLQNEQVATAIRTWTQPGGVMELVTDLLENGFVQYRDSKTEVDLSLEVSNLKQCRRKLSDGHFTAAIRVLTSSGIASKNDATLHDLKEKHPESPPPTIPDLPLSEKAVMIDSVIVAERIRSFPKGTSCGRDGLRAQHLLDSISGVASIIADDLCASMAAVVNLFLEGKCPGQLGEYVASAPLTPLLKPGGGIRPIAVGTVWRRLVSKCAAFMVGKSVGTYLEDLQFGVGVSGGSEAILHAVNRVVEAKGDNDNLTMLLVDFKNAFNLVDRSAMLREVRSCCPSISRWVEFCYAKPARLYYGDSVLRSCQGVQQGDPLGPLLFALVLHPLARKIKAACDLELHAWYLDDGTIIGDTLEVGKAFDIISDYGVQYGLNLNVNKTEVWWPREDIRSRDPGVFPPDIARPADGVCLLGGPVSKNVEFNQRTVGKRVQKTISLMHAIRKLQDPQSELLLLRSCAGVARLYFAMRTTAPEFFTVAQPLFDTALMESLQHIVTAAGPGFGTWQWRLASMPINSGGLGTYMMKDTLFYSFIASRLQSSDLQGKILRHAGLTTVGKSFETAISHFRNFVHDDTSSVCLDQSAPQHMKTLAAKYFKRVEDSIKKGELEIGEREKVLWNCVRSTNAQNFLSTVPIHGLNQTMKPAQFRSVLGYRLCIPLFEGHETCPACKKKVMDKWGDHAVQCANDIGLKFRHDLVRDVFFDICSKVSIPAKKEVNLGCLAVEGKALKPADILLANWSLGKDTCVDITGVSPFAGVGTEGFIPGRAVFQAGVRKKKKYETKCGENGYSFAPFAFTTFGELGEEALEILSRIRQVAKAHTSCAKLANHIINRISFAIQKGVGAQLVARLPASFM